MSSSDNNLVNPSNSSTIHNNNVNNINNQQHSLNNNELVDVGKKKGKSKASAHLTVKNHFNNYLVYANMTEGRNTFDALLEKDVSDSALIGKFSDYISKKLTAVRKYSTHDNYISVIHVMLKEKFPAVVGNFDSYYKNLRTNVHSEYVKKSVETGASMVDSSVCCKVTDKNFICNALFHQKNHELRAFVALDWVAAGRINEVSNKQLFCF